MQTKMQGSRSHARESRSPQAVGRSIIRVSAPVVAPSLALLAAALCFAAPSYATTKQIFEHSYPLTQGGSFMLENINGSVQVEGWDRDEVEVQAVKSEEDDSQDLNAVKIEVDSQPGQVAVHTRYPQGQTADVAVEYHVHVPYKILLGSVETVNGSVVVRGVEGSGELRSVNGNVEVLDSSGRFNARTTNGDLRLELRRLLDGGPMNIETVNGSVVLGLPSDARANLKVLSMNGDLTSDLPVTPAVPDDAPNTVHAKLGIGGGNISVRTVNGAVRLVVQRPGV
ncbi:MAG: DUF4097 family beta strand repeat-containing protein [Candidatus Acidiferrales bacterium]